MQETGFEPVIESIREPHPNQYHIWLPDACQLLHKKMGSILENTTNHTRKLFGMYLSLNYITIAETHEAIMYLKVLPFRLYTNFRSFLRISLILCKRQASNLYQLLQA